MEANKEIYQAVDALARTIAEDYRSKIIEGKSVATGDLSRFTYTLEVEGSRYICYFNLPEQWKYVEYGRRKGAKMPPPDPIRQWIEIKRIVPRGKITIPQLTFLIARGISKNGIPPRNYLSSAIDGHEKDFDATAEVIAEIVGHEIEKKIAEL